MTEIANTTEAPNGWGRPPAGREIDLPSGASVRIVPLEVPQLIGLGILDKLDSFAPQVMDKSGGKKKKGKDDDVALTPEKLTDLVEVLDKITVACVVSPRLSHADPDGIESPDKLYVSYVPLQDKMAIFQNAFQGMDELFRHLGDGQEEDLGTVASVEGV